MKTKKLFLLAILVMLLASCYHSHLYKPGDTLKMTEKEYLVVASRHHHIPPTWVSVSRTEMTLKLIDAKTFDSLSSTFIVRDISVCWQICLAIFMIVLGIVLIRALHARYYISGILLFLLMLCGYILIWATFSHLFAMFLSIWLLFIAQQTLLHYVDISKK